MFTSISEGKEWLDQRLMPNGNDIYQKMRETVKLLGQKRQLSNLLELVLNNPEHLRRLASQSYYHYNGFDKLVLLASTNPQYKLRLHIWWPSSDGSITENVHDHKWDFSSIILVGSYRSQEFQLSDNGIEMYEYKYFSPKGQDHYSMDFVGTAKLKCVSDCIMAAGYSYTQPHSVLHRVISLRQELTATLMLEGPTKDAPVSVFSDHQIQNHGHLDSSPFSVPVVIQKIENFLAALHLPTAVV